MSNYHQLPPTCLDGCPGQDATARLLRALAIHPLSDNQREDILALRFEAADYGTYLTHAIPAGRERSLALTALEESVAWAHKAIQLEGQPTPPPTAWPSDPFGWPTDPPPFEPV